MFSVNIATIEKQVFNTSNAISVTVPTTSGEITILDKHINLTTIVSKGVIKVIDNEDRVEYLSVAGGVLEVNKVQSENRNSINSNKPSIDGESADEESETITKVAILARSADRAAELDQAVIDKARAQAEEALEQADTLSEKEYRDLINSLTIQEIRSDALARYNQ